MIDVMLCTLTRSMRCPAPYGRGPPGVGGHSRHWVRYHFPRVIVWLFTHVLVRSGLGHLGVQFAKAMGYRVIALSSGPSKEALARELGAHEYIDGSKVDQAEALLALGGAKVIMCTAPNAEVIQKLLPGLAIDGTLLLIALEGAPITVSPST